MDSAPCVKQINVVLLNDVISVDKLLHEEVEGRSGVLIGFATEGPSSREDHGVDDLVFGVGGNGGAFDAPIGDEGVDDSDEVVNQSVRSSWLRELHIIVAELATNVRQVVEGRLHRCKDLLR